MINVVIYARFSSHNQNEQSIEGQLKACYEYAEQNEYNVVKEYIDRAISGKTDNRPEFQHMLEDSEKKHFQYILVYQLDRFSRNRYDSAIYKNKLKKFGIRVLSVRENISEDASGILMESVLEGMAEYYSAELGQKIKRGMDINASKCLSTGGNVAFGFKVNEHKQFIIDEMQALTVKEIFQMYGDDSTMAEIIRYLNKKQIKTSRGNKFNKNSIRRILTNKRYIGTYTYCDTEIKNGIPRIIDDELFNAVQIKMQKNKKAPARSKAKEEYLLTTKLFCGLCNAGMIGTSGKGKYKTYHYYTCVNARKKECDKQSIGKSIIEDIVVTETKKILTNKNINKIAKEVVRLCKIESNTPIINSLQLKIRDNEKAINNLLKALEQGDISELITSRIKQKQQEQAELKKQLEKETFQFPNLTVDEVRFFLYKFKEGDINDTKYRRLLINTFIRKIILFEDKLIILYNVNEHQSELHLDEKSSSMGHLVEARGVEPL